MIKYQRSVPSSQLTQKGVLFFYFRQCTCMYRKVTREGIEYLLTFFRPSLPVEHRPSTTSPSHCVLGCSGRSRPVGPLLFQLCFSVSPPTVARPASLPLPLRVPGQGLACGAGCWLPERVSDPAPLSPQCLLGHWFLSRSLPQIFISDPLSVTHIFR